VIALLLDVRKGVDEEADAILEKLPELKQAKVLILNKIDLIERSRLLELAASLNRRVAFAHTFMISALTGDGIDRLRTELAGMMPEGPWLYPEDQISDAPLRMLAAEITREKIYERLHEELPYQSTVETDQWQQRPDGSIRIEQTVFVERDSQRKIVLGKGGQTIKAIGQAARVEIAEAADAKVHLFLHVKVRENWADDPARYREMGLEFPRG
jgi:GTP-binding protein Era